MLHAHATCACTCTYYMHMQADQLLEMGFRPDVLKILAALRPSAATRQTLLFSATLPKDVVKVAEFATRDATLVDTVGEEAEQTNAHVAQVPTNATPHAAPSPSPSP